MPACCTPHLTVTPVKVNLRASRVSTLRRLQLEAMRMTSEYRRLQNFGSIKESRTMQLAKYSGELIESIWKPWMGINVP